MARKKPIWKRFTKWLVGLDNLHYVLLTLTIFFGYAVGDAIGFTNWAMSSGYVGLTSFFFWVWAWLVVGDKIIHKTLNV